MIANNYNFVFSFTVFIQHSFSCFTAFAKTSRTNLNNCDSNTFCLFLILIEASLLCHHYALYMFAVSV